MKFFHLADLHLGKRVNGFPMIEDQKYILKQILEMIDRERPDGIILAGDIYDKSIPSVEAVNLFDDFLADLVRRGLQVFVISGNHDSAERVSYGGRVFEQSGIHISRRLTGKRSGQEDPEDMAGQEDPETPSDPAAASDPVTVSDSTASSDSAAASDPAGREDSGSELPGLRPVCLEDEYGPLRVWLIPYIHPSVIREIYPEDKITDWTGAMKALLSHAQIDPEARNLAVAHQYVTAGGVRPEESDSEQRHIGGLDNVDVSVFDGFDYVALGHLHGPQRIGRDTVRYAGSPLKYSFSEEHQKKAVTVLEMKAKDQVEIRQIPLAPMRDLRTLRGTFDEVMSQEKTASLSAEDYYRIILTDEHDVDQALSRLRSRHYKNLMELSYDNTRTKTQNTVEAEEEAIEKEPSEVLEDLYKIQNGAQMSDFQKELAARLIDEIWNRG